ncbi:MAG: S41 family peptidase [Bryobacteraceae bacterium]
MRWIAVFIFAGCAWGAGDPAAPLETGVKTIVDVFAAVEANAADPVPSDVAFYQGAIPGMLRTLDPHSIFFDPGQFAQLKRMEQSEQKGFGSIVSVLPGRVIVLQTLPGTPSAKAGLAAGDEILAINNYEIARLEFDQLVQLLTIARQHDAALDVRRPGNARIFRIILKPGLVDQPSVDRAFEIAPGIGYLRIASFDQDTGKLVKQTIEKLGGDRLKGLVMDLRGNPGGVAQAAVEVASLFLKPDQLVFSVQGRAKKTEEVRVDKLARPYTFPLAVLIDAKSASASEIVTGALQDHDRATVFGEPSYGKGLVQNVYSLSDSTGLALTVAYYYTPSGRSIQHPLHGGTLDAATSSLNGIYHTDSGREVRGGGGIDPDVVVHPASVDRLSIVLDASGALTSFASEYLETHKIQPDFQVGGELLDQLQVYLSARNIRPGVGDWLSHRDWIQSRLQQEFLNLAFGVAKGDEIQMRRDPVVQAAFAKLGSRR